jgi:hypothetical protein
MVNRDKLYQQGKVNRRDIRRRDDIDVNDMMRIEEEYRVRKTIAILKAFPQILGLNPNEQNFSGRCHVFFRENLVVYSRITAEHPSQ